MIKSYLDLQYTEILKSLFSYGKHTITRGHEVLKSRLYTFSIDSDESPILQCRKVAWKTALREYEWFMSGDPKLPDDNTLNKWWAGQMDEFGEYPYGYGENLRAFTTTHILSRRTDQLSNLIKGVRDHPNSRRNVVTLWNPVQADYIADKGYDKMPTTCHGTVIQCFVEGRELHMFMYQRSADIMLGVPHNLVQYKALLMFLAHHAGYEVGTLDITLGDTHIYKEHQTYARNLATTGNLIPAPQLSYSYSGKIDSKGLPLFLADDFKLKGSYNPEKINSLPLIV